MSPKTEERRYVVDSFRIELGWRQQCDWRIWRNLAAASDAITAHHLGAETEPLRGGSLRAGELRLEGKTVSELQAVADAHELELFTVEWNYAFENLRWAITCRVYEDWSSNMDVTAYAGTARDTTERGVLALIDSMRELGVEPTVRATRQLSKRGGQSPQARAEAKAMAKARTASAEKPTEP